MGSEPLDDQAIGWRVLDPDGNVVAFGPGMTLESAATMGDDAAGDVEEGAGHGGD